MKVKRKRFFCGPKEAKNVILIHKRGIGRRETTDFTGLHRFKEPRMNTNEHEIKSKTQEFKNTRRRVGGVYKYTGM